MLDSKHDAYSSDSDDNYLIDSDSDSDTDDLLLNNLLDSDSDSKIMANFLKKNYDNVDMSFLYDMMLLSNNITDGKTEEEFAREIIIKLFDIFNDKASNEFMINFIKLLIPSFNLIITDNDDNDDNNDYEHPIFMHIGRLHYSLCKNNEDYLPVLNEINNLKKSNRMIYFTLVSIRTFAKGLSLDSKWISQTKDAILNDDYWFEKNIPEYSLGKWGSTIYGEDYEDRQKRIKDRLDSNRLLIIE